MHMRIIYFVLEEAGITPESGFLPRDLNMPIETGGERGWEQDTRKFVSLAGDRGDLKDGQCEFVDRDVLKFIAQRVCYI